VIVRDRPSTATRAPVGSPDGYLVLAERLWLYDAIYWRMIGWFECETEHLKRHVDRASRRCAEVACGMCETSSTTQLARDLGWSVSSVERCQRELRESFGLG
jgi:hypothetical protein